MKEGKIEIHLSAAEAHAVLSTMAPGVTQLYVTKDLAMAHAGMPEPAANMLNLLAKDAVGVYQRLVALCKEKWPEKKESDIKVVGGD